MLARSASPNHRQFGGQKLFMCVSAKEKMSSSIVNIVSFVKVLKYWCLLNVYFRKALLRIISSNFVTPSWLSITSLWCFSDSTRNCWWTYNLNHTVRLFMHVPNVRINSIYQERYMWQNFRCPTHIFNLRFSQFDKRLYHGMTGWLFVWKAVTYPYTVLALSHIQKRFCTTHAHSNFYSSGSS